MSELLETNKVAVLQMYKKGLKELEADLNTLKNWLRKQEHLPEMDDARIERFYLNSKFNMEKTKKMIDSYWTLRTTCPEFFAERLANSPKMLDIYKSFGWIQLKKLTDKHERVAVFRVLDNDVNLFDPWEYYKYVFMMEDIRLHHEYSYGVHLIFDLADVKLGHITKLRPNIFSKSYKTFTEGYGVKMQGIHILNAPSFLNVILALVRPLIKAKIYQRFRIHKDLDSLHAVIPKEILPEEYGGKTSNFKCIHDEWIDALNEWQPWFLKDMQTRVDESKRPQKAKKDAFNRKFQQLEID